MPMNSAHSQSTLFARVQQMPVDPKVKSAKTRKLFNAGVRGNAGMSKIADPTCYDGMSIKQRSFDMQYIAFYEDRAKTSALINDEDEAYSEVAHSAEARTARQFNNLEDAVAWVSKAVDASLTVFGCGEVREIEKVKRPCRGCICRGSQIVRRHICDENGIEETHEEESDCI